MSDQLAEIVMYKAILVRSSLNDLHPAPRMWL